MALHPFEIALRDALRKRADDKDAEKLRVAEERAKKVKRDSLGLPIAEAQLALAKGAA